MEGKTAVVVGAGQTPGETIGNGRAMAVLECRCGFTQVDIQQRGSVILAIPRPGKALGGSSGIDASVIL